MNYSELFSASVEARAKLDQLQQTHRRISGMMTGVSSYHPTEQPCAYCGTPHSSPSCKQCGAPRTQRQIKQI